MPEPEFRLVNVSGRPIEMHGRDGSVQVLNPGDSVSARDAPADAATHEWSGVLLRQPMPSPDKPAPGRAVRAAVLRVGPASGPRSGAQDAHPDTNAPPDAPPAAQKAKPRKGEPA